MQEIPEGWVLVPVELTEAMNVAGIIAASQIGYCFGKKALDEKRHAIYKAQINVAPKPPFSV